MIIAEAGSAVHGPALSGRKIQDSHPLGSRGLVTGYQRGVGWAERGIFGITFAGMGTFFSASFWLLAFLAAYILVGYPLLLAFLAARFGKPIKKSPVRKTVSILIAVYNGAAVIR